jgi:1-acyl-sn-glycerol-3-phosphate acyltransferase
VSLIQALRSAAFYFLFMGQTVVLAIVVGTVSIIARRRTAFAWAIVQYWVRSNLLLLRWVVGIHSRIEGTENVPAGGCIIASKHQSDWDIFAILPHAVPPAFIAKRQLLDIPFFGWAARTFDTIRLDRDKGGDAIPQMLADARRALDRGCRIIIFPEGTRRAPFAPPDYRYGIVRLYEAMTVPVVPVALNSGLCWGRNGAILWPGTVTARFLAPIAPGLPPAEFAMRLQETIESETESLLQSALASGISRPIPAEWRGSTVARPASTGRNSDTTY